MRHVLVVDDEPAICELVQMVLEADGSCRVTRVSTAGDAMGILKHDRPDAALIDAVLPQVSGLQLATRAVDLGVPVLIVTGEPQTRDKLHAAGCPYLSKPFSIGTLVSETRALLDEAVQRRAELGLLLRPLVTKTAELRIACERLREAVVRTKLRRNAGPRRPGRRGRA